MAKNWIPAKSHFSNKPTESTVSGAVHARKDQALLVEELAGKYAIFIVKKTQPKEVLETINKGIESHIEAKQVAEDWMDENEQGI